MTGSPPLSARPDLVDVAPYVSPQQPARYRMNTNESPYPPPRQLVEEVAHDLREVALNRYPDRDATRLLDAISGHVSWPSEGLWVANGSNEVFLHLFLAFGGARRTALVFEPTYSLHSLIPKVAGTRVVQGRRDASFRIDLDGALQTIERDKPEVVIVCSPNNPTGTLEPRATVEALCDAAPGIVVVDEAYGEFAGAEHSARALLQARPNLTLVKTFSKAWRLAGVRIGYMVAAPELVDEMARVRLPYHLSAVTQIVGESAIRHADETLELAGAISRERDRIAQGLAALGIRTHESHANFVLFDVDEPEVVWKSLLEREVLVRRYDGTPGLERCLRVTAGLPDETDAFLSAMEEVAGGR